MAAVIRITEASTYDDICAAIRELKRRHDRLPAHFEEQRKVLMDEIETLVDRALLVQ